MAVTVMEMVGKLVGDTTDFERSMAGAERSMGVTAKRIRVGAGIAATAITGGLVVAAKVGWDQFQSGQLVAAQTEAVLKSTGDAANVTASHIKDLGVALMNKSGIDDQVIRSGENVLATFQDVRNEAGKGRDIFDQATRAALDLSVATGRDLTSANKTVGRALNDPIKGLASLTRLGIKFTDQEKAQMQTMVDHNNIIGAQQVILAKLNTAYGGSADISGTVAGKMAIAREQFKNTAETLVGALLPAFTAIMGPIASMAAFLGRHTTLTKALVVALGGLAVVLYAVSAATRIYAAAQVILNVAMSANPIGIVVVALAALAVGLVVAYKKSETFRRIVGAAADFVKSHWLLLAGVLTGALIPAIVLVVQHFRAIKDVFLSVSIAVLGGVKKILEGFSLLMHAAGKMPGPLGAPFRAAADEIDKAIGKVSALQTGLNNLKSKTIHVNAVVTGLGYVSALQEHIALLHDRSVSVAAHRASGGAVAAGMPYIVGERRPELFIPSTSGTIVPRVAAAGTGTVYNFNGPVLDGDRLLRFIQNEKQRYERRNGRSPF